MSSDFYSSNSQSTAAACSSSRWLTEEVFKLIDMVQRDEAIYNPRHKYYFCRPYVENFWREVDLKLEKNPGASLAKWTNLRISFRREYTNYLEEKVPPCWSYFDRMFFLHPYLRKKHQQPKSLDSQVQDALVQISCLSNRLQRERAVAAASAVAASSLAANNTRTNHQQEHQQQLADNYLDYFDDADNDLEQNNSELDEIIEDEQHEQQQRFQNMETHSLNNDIKSECDDNIDTDYDTETRNEEADDKDADDTVEMHDFGLDSALASSSTQQQVGKRHRDHLRMQHLSRLQTRYYHDDLRAKRPRSQENISSSQMTSVTHVQQRSMLNSTTPTTHSSNVSFVRPTFSKPAMEMVSTTTNHTTSHSHRGEEETNIMRDVSPLPAAATASSTSLQLSAHSQAHQQQQQLQNRHVSHLHRLEISSVSSGNATTAAGTSSVVGASVPSATTHLELCDCKTDPDAMFLMSLLPDIQKLNGRDRGKIKIAFQNILQDYLYPD